MAKPKALPKLLPEDIARFWSCVEVRSSSECWPWTRSTFRRGYGQFKARGRNLKAHRIAFALFNGNDCPDNLVCHTCDNTSCCNGHHLYAGDNISNYADCVARGRTNFAAGERHGSQTQPERWARGERVSGAKLNAAKVTKIRSLYLTGDYTQQQLATQFSVTREGISSVLTGRTWSHIENNVAAIAEISRQQLASSGTRNPSAKLSEADVVLIRSLYNKGNATYRALAQRFGVTPVNIAAIVQRRTWKDLA